MVSAEDASPAVPLVDPRRVAVLTRMGPGQPYQDQTWKIADVREDRHYVHITFKGGKSYPYGRSRALVLNGPTPVPVTPRSRVAVGDQEYVTNEVLRFPHTEGAWLRIFRDSGKHVTVPESQARIRGNAAGHPGAARVMTYLRDIVGRMNPDSPIHRPFAHLEFIDRESALGRFLHDGDVGSHENERPPIYPWGINLSQREAVHNALDHSVSVVQGPPGTGKTHVILTVVANLVRTPGTTVGVVSLSNPAVENVRDKLVKRGFGWLIADLGKREKRDAFFAGLEKPRHERAVALAGVDPTGPLDKELANLDKRLSVLDEKERERAETDHELLAYQVEQRHFLDHLGAGTPVDPVRLPLLRRSSRHLLRLLAETATYPLPEQRLGRISWWLRAYLANGVVGRLDPEDSDLVLQLQQRFYERRIAELAKRSAKLTKGLERAKFRTLRQDLAEQSLRSFRADLAHRYANLRVTPAPEKPILTPELLAEFPVVISTCHSLRSSLPRGVMLDYLIVDEASQVDLATAALGLALARHVVVVGDMKQLTHIAEKDVTRDLVAPAAWANYDKNLLAATLERHGPSLPTTLLREHYRCDAAIIEFCNRKFYDGALIPFTTTTPENRPLRVIKTTPGNHMRRPRSGGAMNQREADVVHLEVIPQHLVGVPPTEIAVVTPFRNQVETLAKTIDPEIDKNTVHKYQGQEKDAVVMNTVISETWRGQLLLDFVDDAQLVNVAVSRAAKRFILVTNHDMLPKSRNLRDLIDYIEYRDHEALSTSKVVSVFDLLYAEYAEAVRPLVRRVGNRSRFRSENIVWAVLDEILAEERFRHLNLSFQVYLRNLLRGTESLTDTQRKYVRYNASVDFVLYNRVTNKPVVAIEVDGWAFHADSTDQLRRDNLKNEILDGLGLRLVRLPTVDSGIESRIRDALDEELV
ncbi:AAA domain-containing protein [Antribacter gilvus]|uniref:AAA domain-containing protein n=1 Tax=Antribacter gilvus TaxID=2304675 RepID=UPI0013E0A7DA|nr:AAA domain-containing protein [Antribacter gilvus]